MIKELSSSNANSDDLAQFTNISKMILEKKALLKEKYGGYNQAKLMNKNLLNTTINHFSLLNDIEKKKQKQLGLHIKDREMFL